MCVLSVHVAYTYTENSKHVYVTGSEKRAHFARAGDFLFST